MRISVCVYRADHLDVGCDYDLERWGFIRSGRLIDYVRAAINTGPLADDAAFAKIIYYER